MSIAVYTVPDALKTDSREFQLNFKKYVIVSPLDGNFFCFLFEVTPKGLHHLQVLILLIGSEKLSHSRSYHMNNNVNMTNKWNGTRTSFRRLDIHDGLMAHPCPIFSKRVYFFLGSPTLTIVPELKKEQTKQKLIDWSEQTVTCMESKTNEILPFNPHLVLQYHWIWMDRTVSCLSIHPNSALCWSHSGQCSMLTGRKSWEKRRWREGTRDESKKKQNMLEKKEMEMKIKS